MQFFCCLLTQDNLYHFEAQDLIKVCATLCGFFIFATSYVTLYYAKGSNNSIHYFLDFLLTFHCNCHSHSWSFFFVSPFNVPKPPHSLTSQKFFNGSSPVIFSINLLLLYLSVSCCISLKAFSFGWTPFLYHLNF